MKVKFAMEKVTKNTVRFAEQLENELDSPVIGTLYVPKATLKALGWTDGKTLSVELKAGEEAGS